MRNVEPGVNVVSRYSPTMSRNRELLLFVAYRGNQHQPEDEDSATHCPVSKRDGYRMSS
jgi:hypothetical protein